MIIDIKQVALMKGTIDSFSWSSVHLKLKWLEPLGVGNKTHFPSHQISLFHLYPFFNHGSNVDNVKILRDLNADIDDFPVKAIFSTKISIQKNSKLEQIPLWTTEDFKNNIKVNDYQYWKLHLPR